MLYISKHKNVRCVLIYIKNANLNVKQAGHSLGRITGPPSQIPLTPPKEWVRVINALGSHVLVGCIFWNVLVSERSVQWPRPITWPGFSSQYRNWLMALLDAKAPCRRHWVESPPLPRLSAASLRPLLDRWAPGCTSSGTSRRGARRGIAGLHGSSLGFWWYNHYQRRKGLISSRLILRFCFTVCVLHTIY